MVLCLASLAACSDGDDGSEVVAGATTSSSAPATTPAPAPTTNPLEGFSTTPVSVAAPAQRALLRAVRADHHPGFDRAVFEFENTAPGYSVRYVPKPVTEDGSGNQVPVAGASVLEVRMENASGADLQGENVRQTYTGPRRMSPPATTAIAELVQTGDFEAVLTWVIGTTAQAPYKVTVLAGPPRLVVDVAA